MDWLLNHLVVRHAPKSRPHKCLFEGCTLRFPKVGTLRDHIRSAHTDTNIKQNGRKSMEESNVKLTCFEFRPLVHFPSGGFLKNTKMKNKTHCQKYINCLLYIKQNI